MNLKQKYEKNKDLVTLKESTKYPGLFVLKYKKKVFFKGLWNPFLEEARGLVVDKDFNIVSRPFTKIYNYGVEQQAPEFDDYDLVHVYRKVNGFMVAATYYEGNLIVSTTGSLDSLFVNLGRSYLEKCPLLLEKLKEDESITAIFECCDNSDPHIVQETPGLYLLAVRDKMGSLFVQHDYLKLFLGDEGLFLPSYSCEEFRFVKEKVSKVKHEGYVIYDMYGEKASKIKSPYYLTKKMLMRKNMDKLMSMDAKEFLDEEFYPLIDYIKEFDREYFSSLDELAKREYIEKWFESK